MSADSDPRSNALPESNADSVASKMVFESVDGDGTGLVGVLRLLLSRAEQITAIHQKFGQLDQQLLAGHLPEQEEFNAELLDVLYDPICLKWFLARAFKAISERLEFEVYEQQQNLRPICSIVFNNNGDVESFRLQSSDVSPGE